MIRGGGVLVCCSDAPQVGGTGQGGRENEKRVHKISAQVRKVTQNRCISRNSRFRYAATPHAGRRRVACVAEMVGCRYVAMMPPTGGQKVRARWTRNEISDGNPQSLHNADIESFGFRRVIQSYAQHRTRHGGAWLLLRG